MSRPSTPHRARDSCPLCGALRVAAHDPFCSQGCRDRDLLQWLDDGYRIPGPPADDEEALDSPTRPPL